MFDPYTDDPRLGIQRIFLCPVSDILVVAGTAGQVIVLQMEREQRELDIKVRSQVCKSSSIFLYVEKNSRGLFE